MAEPELRHLRSFLAVARELNITRAAQSPHLAQQAVSRHIHQLEVDRPARTPRRRGTASTT